MVIGICHVEFLIHESCSLKSKRRVLKKIIANIQNRYNISVAEVGSNDLWQRGEIGIAVVGNDKAHLNSLLDKALNYIETLGLAEVIDHSIEFFNS
ncbi:MAG: DUF503 domain-containing protein [Deltaproteobacteria bacterium]|nr:DUF503 domain-containing protein [Deltaproteobacteria bacterium]